MPRMLKIVIYQLLRVISMGGGGIGYSAKATFLFSSSISETLANSKLTGNERFRKSEISAFIIIKNYWNRFINQKVTKESVSDFDDEKCSAFLFFVLPVTKNKEEKPCTKADHFSSSKSDTLSFVTFSLMNRFQ